MTTSALARKLLIKHGQRIAIVNPPPGDLAELEPLPEGVEVVGEPVGTFGFVHLFVRNVAELDRDAPAAIGAVTRDGLLWISYPKRSSKVETDITRDVGWEAVRNAGLEPVTQISIDDVWSALRFSPSDLVNRAKRS